VTWRDRAACRGLEVDEALRIFFPYEEEGQRVTLYDTARSYCSRCPVAGECLREALMDVGFQYGFRGGKSPSARDRLRVGVDRRQSIKCKACDKEFLSDHSTALYCSNTCRTAAWRTKGRTRVVTCPCGATFTPAQKSLKFCSPGCQAESDRRRWRESKQTARAA
jgi:hypothetical protein